MAIQVGKKNKLKVVREAEFGYFLSDGIEDVLLHKNDINQEVVLDQVIEVFIFTDKAGRKTASTTIPSMIDDHYDWVEVVDVRDKMGAFIDIGLSKDVIVSNDDLPKLRALWPQVGDKLFVTIKVDRLNRLFARLVTENVALDLAKSAPLSMKNQAFRGYAYRVLKVGTFVLTEEGYRCFIHEDERERNREPRLGELVEGRVIGISAEGDLNGSLLPRGHERMADDAQMIYAYLLQRNGTMPFTDKSDAADIERKFGISKVAFKRALGRLMKDRKIKQADGWTSIIEQEVN